MGKPPLGDQRGDTSKETPPGHFWVKATADTTTGTTLGEELWGNPLVERHWRAPFNVSQWKKRLWGIARGNPIE